MAFIDIPFHGLLALRALVGARRRDPNPDMAAHLCGYRYSEARPACTELSVDFCDRVGRTWPVSFVARGFGEAFQEADRTVEIAVLAERLTNAQHGYEALTRLDRQFAKVTMAIIRHNDAR